MDRQIRPVTDDEFADFMRVVGTAFGEVPTTESIEDDRTWGELDRSLAVFEAGQIVAGAGAYSFELTLPGGRFVPAAGVTWVGVLPTHRRRGILRDMMARQLADVAERDEPVAVLTASEGSIYRRFGYGVATRYVNVEVVKDRSAFLVPPGATGRVRMVGKEEAGKLLPAVHDAYRRQRVGAVNRNERYWEMWFRDREPWRGGASARFCAVHESDGGVADGAVAYRFKEDWNPSENRSQVWVMGLFTTDPEVEAALWRFVLDMDLAVAVKGHTMPVDNQLQHRLVDSRAYRVVDARDWLWACLVDVAGALAARCYGVDGTLVLEVADRFRPEAGGRFRLEGGPSGASCERTTAEPDLVLAAADLGAVYLGGTRFGALRRAGLVEERTAGAAAMADALFAVDPLPHCDTGF